MELPDSGSSGHKPPDEFRRVLEAVIQTFLQATWDRRLPELTPEQMHYWFTHLTIEDVAAAHAEVRSAGALRSPASRGLEPAAIREAFESLGEVVSRAVDSSVQQNSAASAKRNCPGCGKSLASTDRFCPECGRTAVAARHCLNCNADLEGESTFCPSCGAKAA